MLQHDWLAGAAEVEEAEPCAAGPSPAVMSSQGCRPQRRRRGSQTADLQRQKERGLISVIKSRLGFTLQKQKEQQRERAVRS